ncbi:MAG: tetratricopeptide repeat protein [Deltaproteobacteria bacterium]|nr:tetratricopeptide repeat protein [Deltaproteobacteria bacterium]
MMRVALALLLGLSLAVGGSPDAWAKDGDKQSKASKAAAKKNRKNFAVSEWAYKRLNKAHELLADEKYDEAVGPLKELERRKSTSAHERALTWQTYAYIHSSQGHYEKAIGAFEKCLAQDALPEATRLSTLYNIGQLYLSVDRFKEAVSTFESWLSQVENPAASAYYLVAVAHMQGGDIKKARPYARKAVGRAGRPVESSLQLLLAIEFELKNYKQVERVLEALVTYFPKKAYFTQLSAIYGELGKEKRALAVLELAYVQDLLARESELVNLAQRYLHHEVPYRGARVLAKGLDEGIITNTSENWELLSNAWLQARENDEAVGPLERAAALSADGDLFVRLAQVHLEREDSTAALKALRKALEKGKLAEPGKAQLLRGIAFSGSKQFGPARTALTAAQKYEKSRHQAQQWMAHVESQEAAAIH